MPRVIGTSCAAQRLETRHQRLAVCQSATPRIVAISSSATLGASSETRGCAAGSFRPSAPHDDTADCCSSGRCRDSLRARSARGQAPAVDPWLDGRWTITGRLLAGGIAAIAPAALAASSSQAAEELLSSTGNAAGAASAVTAAAAAAADVASGGAAAATTAATAMGGGAGLTAAELAAAGVSTAVPAGYVPSPLEPGWEVWVGFVAGVVPFAIGAYEFGKRILIQLRCEVCGGRGLVASAGAGRDKYLRKCPQCGGFFPWISWKMFLSSTAAPGNGGPLQQPRGQRGVLYSVPQPPSPERQAEARARSQAAVDAAVAQADGRRPVSGGGQEADAALAEVDGGAQKQEGQEEVQQAR